MSKIVVYHGSSTEVKEPSLEYGRYDNFNNKIVISPGVNISSGTFYVKIAFYKNYIPPATKRV